MTAKVKSCKIVECKDNGRVAVGHIGDPFPGGQVFTLEIHQSKPDGYKVSYILLTTEEMKALYESIEEVGRLEKQLCLNGTYVDTAEKSFTRP